MNNKVIISIAKIFVIVLLVFSYIPAASAQNTSEITFFGFNFGTSDKDAKNIIKSKGKTIVKNDVDSKEIRTILFDGTIEDLYLDKPNKQTRLEFYKSKLMSSSLIFYSLTGDSFIKTLNELLTEVVTAYGEPSGRDNMLSYDIWTWYFDDVKFIVSSNRNKGVIQMEYTYEPISEYKVQNELEKKRKVVEDRHPVDRMFKDGDYSATGGPGIARPVPGAR